MYLAFFLKSNGPDEWCSLEARQQLGMCWHFAEIRQEGMGMTIFLILLSGKQC